ncbi:MAG: single-stranded-DNA-specific exonuclease RecJ [Bacillus sp. (in: Bacteria)]|nr:single-stranded-DNA-specific exonuclease RecJ [Bacillus sp. (in: firmicutes)]MCM1427965.1 single-stranded-DNA-specific exonuclease RecJ [Eubacterium sp.]
MAKWVVSAKRADFAKIAETFRIDPVIARIIRNRNIVGDAQIDFFLNGTIKDLHAPRLLYDMEKAVAFMLSKIKKNVSIRIIGDYDIDGICSAYILFRGLSACGAKVDTVIPHRIKDGYGLNDALIEEAHSDGIDTIITCDNGIAATEQIAYAKELGIDVIVTDHHEAPYEVMEDGTRKELLPPAVAVIDPKQEKCAYPFDGICGAVVAYKFVQVLLEEYEKDGQGGMDNAGRNGLLEELLEFAAFATVGDVMELLDENRVLVKYGLKKMAQPQNPGLRALIEVNGMQGKPLSAYHIGFVLGPCLNATGRLDTAEKALQMLTCNDFAKAVTIAGELKELNDSRKEMTRQGTQQAIDMIEKSGLREDKVLVIYLPDCHESLAGIIAGRIKEKYHKPVFVLTKAQEGVKGSGRSIEAYHMYEQMSLCKHLFTRYGGHKMAAGLSMPEENIEKFRAALNRNCQLSDEDFIEKIVIDVPMPLSYINMDFVRQLQILEPFGNGNPKPVFAQKNVHILQGRLLGKNENVGKYRIQDEQGNFYEMVYFGDLEKWHGFLEDAFGKEEREKLYSEGSGKIVIQMIYYPDINVYKGRESLQIVMQDYCEQ